MLMKSWNRTVVSHSIQVRVEPSSHYVMELVSSLQSPLPLISFRSYDSVLIREKTVQTLDKDKKKKKGQLYFLSEEQLQFSFCFFSRFLCLWSEKKLIQSKKFEGKKKRHLRDFSTYVYRFDCQSISLISWASSQWDLRCSEASFHLLQPPSSSLSLHSMHPSVTPTNPWMHRIFMTLVRCK